MLPLNLPAPVSSGTFYFEIHGKESIIKKWTDFLACYSSSRASTSFKSKKLCQCWTSKDILLQRYDYIITMKMIFSKMRLTMLNSNENYCFNVYTLKGVRKSSCNFCLQLFFTLGALACKFC